MRSKTAPTVLKEMERTLKAAADATRLRILGMLREGPLCVCQMVEILRLSQSTVSQHLLLLKSAGWIEDERRGKWAFYRISAETGGPLGAALGRLVAEALVRDPRVAEDLRKLRRPKVREMTACCPSPPEVPSRGRGAEKKECGTSPGF